MIIGITGATGFVGRELVRQHLARGDRVRLLSRNEPPADRADAEWIRADLCGEPHALARFCEGLDVLYHCAGETRDEHRMRATNVRGTAQLLEAASGRVGRWVQLSSVGAYGPRRTGIVAEDAPENPVGEYEITKTEADRLVASRARAGGFDHVVLRPCKIMGTRMRDRSLYSLFRLAERGLFVVGRPDAILNYVHVQDVARALLVCGTAPSASGVYNVARQITVQAFAAAIADALGVSPPRFWLPEGPLRAFARLTGWVPGNPVTLGRINGLTSTTVYASDRIRGELGFEFEVSIEDGLRELIHDYRAGGR